MHSDTHHTRLFLLALALALLALAVLPKPVHSRWLVAHRAQVEPALSGPVACRLDAHRDLK